jgi:hypothetical protein
MKTFLQALLAICLPLCVHPQLYGVNDVGISIQKVNVYNDGNSLAQPKQQTAQVIRPTIGVKFGYELHPFVIEMAGKLNLEMTGFTALYTGAKLYLDPESELSFTPLAGISINHLSFTAAGRLQWQHYCVEFTRFKNISYCTLGFRAYLKE